MDGSSAGFPDRAQDLPPAPSKADAGLGDARADAVGGKTDSAPGKDTGAPRLPDSGPNSISDPVIVIAGDIAGSWTEDQKTADLITQIQPHRVLTVGDNEQNSGTYAQFLANFEPTWGIHKALIHPTPGNHDHATEKLDGYCKYFGAAGHCQGGYSYHSFDVGNWHIVALDSGCTTPSKCPDPTLKGSPMRLWLTADLAANSSRCTLVYWHHPLFTSSKRHSGEKRLLDLWVELYEAGVDVVANGHVHMYERFAPQDPSGKADPVRGIVEFIPSTGGAPLSGTATIQPNSLVRDTATHGVLKLTLHPESYDFEFIPIAGKTFTDKGSQVCNPPGKLPQGEPAPRGSQPPSRRYHHGPKSH